MNYIIDSVLFSLGEANSHKYSIVEINTDRVQLRAGWCGRWDLNPHVYGWTQAPQACLSTYSSTPAWRISGTLRYYSPNPRVCQPFFSQAAGIVPVVAHEPAAFARGRSHTGCVLPL